MKNTFQSEFVTPRGRVLSSTQTAYVLALSFDLLPDELREVAARRLAEDVRMRGHLTTGFLGTPDLMHVLSANGYWEAAYDLLLRTEYPSWLYPVTMDATTIWERWDGMKPDSTFQTPGMNSFNHYAYGAIGQWLYEDVAGIEATAPGYKSIQIAPHPGGGLTHARAFLDSGYGRIESDWTIAGGQFRLDVTIPANTQATVRLPDTELSAISESGQPITEAEGIANSQQDGEDVVATVGAGRYRFVYAITRPSIWIRRWARSSPTKRRAACFVSTFLRCWRTLRRRGRGPRCHYASLRSGFMSSSRKNGFKRSKMICKRSRTRRGSASAWRIRSVSCLLIRTRVPFFKSRCRSC